LSAVAWETLRRRFLITARAREADKQKSEKDSAMKVYSWKTLVVSIFLGGGSFAYTIIHFDGLHDLVLLAFLAYYIIKGLSVSFSEDAYKEYVKRVERGKRVHRKLFGKFAPLIPWSPAIFVLLGYCVVKLLPTWKWLVWLWLLSAAASAVYISIIFRKHMKIEEEQEQISSEKQDGSDTM